MSQQAICMACLAVFLWVGSAGAQVTVPSGGTPDMNAALSQVAAGGTITVATDLEENGSYLVGSPVTIQGQYPGIRLRNMQFIVTSSRVVFRNLVLDGKNSLGQRNPARKYLIRVTGTAADFTIENCRVVHPASGEGDGLANNAASLNGPGCGLQLEMGGDVTVRNCDFNDDVDEGIDNEVNIFFTSVNPQSGPVLIEGCTFGAHSRCIQINSPHANITIRDNRFLWSGTAGEFADEEVTGVMLCTDFNLLNDPNGPYGTPLKNLLVEGNIFGGTGGQIMNNSGVTLWGPVDGVAIRNNTFNGNVRYEAIGVWAYGRDVVVQDNVVATGSHSSGCHLFGSRSKQLVYGDPVFQLENVVVSGEVFSPINGSGMTLAEMVHGARVENCVFNNCAYYGCWNYVSSNDFVVRGNRFVGCGIADNANVDGAVLVQSPGCVIADNEMIGCRNGVSFDPQQYTAFAPYNTLILRPDHAIVSGNYILGPTRYGIEDTNGSSVDPGGQATGIRIYNNTITTPGVGGMALRSRAMDVYNNILHGGPVAITTTTFAPTFSHRGFNLNYGNSYQGLAPTATDITANPGFVGGLAPAAAADAALLPSSPARNAGASNGVDPDFATEIGAWQETAIDASVPTAAWELYR